MSPTWRERKKLELRQQLYEAALDLFESEGYEATTVQQITDRVGTAKGTFFNHFPSKEHVVAEWYNGITERALKAAAAKHWPSAREAVAGLFADMSGQATRSPELLIAKSRNSIDPLLMDAERVQVAEIHAFLREHIESGRSGGELPADLDVDRFIGLLVAILTGTSRAWVYTEPRFDFPAVIRERIEFLFQAVSPRS